MKPIFYEITDTKVPRLVPNFHENVRLGYAYETTTHYVHFYGMNHKFFAIHTGQTVLENKSTSQYKNLTEWAEYYFGAKNIQSMVSNVGESTEGVWRPGLYHLDLTYKALKTTEAERRLSEQAMRVLLEKLDDIMLYIEPDAVSFNTYGHKLRELLILACTEVENFWAYYMKISNTNPRSRNYSTQDYIKLRDKLFLTEYRCTMKSYVTLPFIEPFRNWSVTAPTASLPWYNAYNKTKHNRQDNFAESSFINVLNSVIASLILYFVKFSPYPLLEESGTLNSLVNQHFKFELINPDVPQSYVPLIIIPADYNNKNAFIYDSFRNGDVQPFIVKPLTL